MTLSRGIDEVGQILRSKMRPKKKEKVSKEEKKPQFEQIQADHELFLQAFEKPTQIYRYLRTRNLIAPVFLNRTLTYMKDRNTRTNKDRETFKVDSLLEKVEAKQNQTTPHNYKTEYMSFTFTGFYDKQENFASDTVDVEAFLVKICHKKRKDVSSPVMQVSIGTVQVPVNPHQRSPSKAAAISVASEKFNYNNGHAVKSYMLLIKVTVKGSHSCNGSVSHSPSSEPPTKRRKNGKVSDMDGTELIFGAELVIYDKHKRCLLTDGDYELALTDLTSRMSPKKQATWETVMDGKAVGPFEVFSICPTLKFKLLWSEAPVNGPVSPPSPLVSDSEFLHNNQYNDAIDNRITSRESSPEKKTKNGLLPPAKKKTRIFYQFLYNNNTRQQTEAHDDLRCPWCSINCLQLYCLLRHLRLCHARFNFVFVHHPKGAQINVSINEGYDGSYLGNPQDLHSHIGYAFCRQGPVRRTPVTQVLVYRPTRPKFSLLEFMESEESDPHNTRQLAQGHNRLYYHTGTCQPVRPQEIDEDSESENDPMWLREKTIQMLDEFTDVNEGEKEIMKMWNIHVMRNNYIADCQFTTACQTFVAEHGVTIVEKNLCRNFLLHMINLYDFGLIKPEIITQTMMSINRIKDEITS
ncbi:polycomb protein suz12 [Lingula anatina]|uniref:Polycomb protein suz12 n=1 Tax=Lingula anatina TaxID=7574 RepID=A0A1S3IUG4_LINAN|nr:polycomb protein suz12 [Lingula anatina]|eukprot:XP_013401571.1 polycomb protein suz12 [Lingula anatina]